MFIPSVACRLTAAFGIAAVLTTGGCANATRTYGANGKPVVGLNCSGPARSWNACVTRAGEECGPAGYTVIEIGGGQGTTANGGYGSYFASPSDQRTMVVECNVPAVK